MLLTVLVMALAVAVEPFRVGVAVAMLNRPRPALQLFAMLCGGYFMAMSVGLTVLFVVRRVLHQPDWLTLSRVQIVIGLLALTASAVVAFPGRLRVGPARLAEPAQRLLSGPSLLVAITAGFGIALPSVDYLAVLAIILASGTAVATQVSALVIYNVVAFALVEIALVAYLLAPAPTMKWVTSLSDWIRARRRVEVVVVLAVIGCLLLMAGIASTLVQR